MLLGPPDREESPSLPSPGPEPLRDAAVAAIVELRAALVIPRAIDAPNAKRHIQRAAERLERATRRSP